MIDVPFEYNYRNPVVAVRSHLPTHDFYSFFVGLVFYYVAFRTVSILYGLIKLWRAHLKRRNAIKRPKRVRPGTDSGFAGSEAASFGGRFEILSLFWQRKGYYWLVRSFKALYLLMTIGFLIPLLFGSVFNVYVILPIQHTFKRTPIVFPLLDWSTGAMGLRILYNIILMAPGQNLAALVNEFNNVNLYDLNLIELTKKIIIPAASVCICSLLCPLIAFITEVHFGMYLILILGLEDHILSTIVFRYGAISIVGAYVVYNVLSRIRASLVRWIEHLKDDQYLVGRALENIE